MSFAGGILPAVVPFVSDFPLLPVRRFHPICLVFALLLLSGCGAPRTEPPGWDWEVLAPPVGAGSALPHLATAPDGSVLLSWVEPDDAGGHRLRWARWQGEGWTPARTIAAGDDWFVNWADFPAIAAREDGALVAHYLQKNGPSPYAYDVRVTQSADGVRWRPAVTPHTDGTQTEHGFVSIVPWTADRVLLTWLDGRHTLGGGHEAHGERGAMTIRAALLDADGRLHEEAVLDARTCDCCQTAAVRTPSGAVVAYRDRSETEVRDISVVRYHDGRWSEPVPVHRDGWQIAGCPVNGPALDAAGEAVVLAWFTAAGDVPHVRVAFSADEGERWSPPVDVDEGAPLGRVDVVRLPDGSAVVSWMEQVDGRAEIRLRRVAPDGTPSPSQAVATTAAARSSGFPRLARTETHLFVAWTEAGEAPVVRVMRAALR